MEDAREVYERPYDHAEPVVCFDEKPVSLHKDVRPARPMAPNRSAPKLAKALKTIIESYPEADTIQSGDGQPERPRSQVAQRLLRNGERESALEPPDNRYTPKHGSWLNQAEKIGLFARQCLARRRIPTLAQLQQETAAWNSKVNAEGKKINWTFTRKKARKKFEYKRT
jgi:hypothetical protein